MKRNFFFTSRRWRKAWLGVVKILNLRWLIKGEEISMAWHLADTFSGVKDMFYWLPSSCFQLHLALILTFYDKFTSQWNQRLTCFQGHQWPSMGHSFCFFVHYRIFAMSYSLVPYIFLGDRINRVPKSNPNPSLHAKSKIHCTTRSIHQFGFHLIGALCWVISTNLATLKYDLVRQRSLR